jgi:biopolymer transport protein ExbB
MLEMLQAAGPLLWVLIALSIYVVYLFILRFQMLQKASGDPTLMLTRVNAALMQQDLSGAQQEARRARTPAANVLRAGLDRAGTGTTASIAAMQDAQLVEDSRLFSGLSTLGTIAQIAPLLGLLGTVIGMVRSFIVFASTASPTPTQLAAGISEALINTGGGLVVAILAYVFRGILRGKADAIALHADRVRESLPAWLLEANLRNQGHISGAPIGLYDPKAQLEPMEVTA